MVLHTAPYADPTETLMTDTLTWHKSACNLCYINCGVELGVVGSGTDARIAKVRGDKDNPRSQGYLCNKAQSIPNYVHHRDRLTTPLRKRPDGTYEEIDWDTAIAEISQKLQTIVDSHGGRTIAAVGGGGQGNHAGGSYAFTLLRALGSRTTFNALAQEKTGDFWINGRLFGSQVCHTAEDIHHCDLLVVLGSNPRLSHGFTNARDLLNGVRKSDDRKLVVIDPRRSETADSADLHLALRPGTDAFLLGALLAELNRRNAFDEKFLAAHTQGLAEVKAVLKDVPVAQWLATTEISREHFDRLVAMVMASKAMVVRVELGIQQGLNSTLNSYLEKLLYLLTGHFGRTGTHWLHSWLTPLWGNTPGTRHVLTGTEIISGLLSPNLIAESVLNDHPDRIRALWVDSSNPLNTAADTGRLEQAIRALDLMVVVDVALTETASLADYVLPAASQYEKCEFTLFNFEVPTNYFHVRSPVLPALPGTLSEPEIYTRLATQMGLMPEASLLNDLAAKAKDPVVFAKAFSEAAQADPGIGKVAGLVLYKTLGPALPDGTAAAAPLWSACLRTAKLQPEAVSRALPRTENLSPSALGQHLFYTVIRARSGTAFTVHADPWGLVEYADHRIHLAIPEMLTWLRELDPASVAPSAEWPFILSAGQRRLNNTNQILRDPASRANDPDGSLYIHPSDLDALGVQDKDLLLVESGRARLVVRARATDSMRKGHIALPHGYGQYYPDEKGGRTLVGPRINWLTDAMHRDPIAGTPLHKYVPVRLQAAPANAVVNSIEVISSV